MSDIIKNNLFLDEQNMQVVMNNNCKLIDDHNINDPDIREAILASLKEEQQSEALSDSIQNDFEVICAMKSD